MGLGPARHGAQPLVHVSTAPRGREICVPVSNIRWRDLRSPRNRPLRLRISNRIQMGRQAMRASMIPKILRARRLTTQPR